MCISECFIFHTGFKLVFFPTRASISGPGSVAGTATGAQAPRRGPPESPPGEPPKTIFFAIYVLQCTSYALIYARKPSSKARLNASRTSKRRVLCLGMSWRRNELIKITLADSGVARTVCMLVVYVNCFVQPTANTKTCPYQ